MNILTIQKGLVLYRELPGCVMYAKRTIFDLLLPRLLADDPITAEDIARLGEGGLCLNCEVCHWPNCGFGPVSYTHLDVYKRQLYYRCTHGRPHRLHAEVCRLRWHRGQLAAHRRYSGHGKAAAVRRKGLSLIHI